MEKPGYFFCTPVDDISVWDNPARSTYEYGNCCPSTAVADERCIDSGNVLEGIQCSSIVPEGELQEAEIAMFMSFEVGMLKNREYACGTTTNSADIVLTATDQSQSLILEGKGILPSWPKP